MKKIGKDQICCLAKHHGKFSCVNTISFIHAQTVAKRTSPRDKQTWKLSKKECQAVIFQEINTIFVYYGYQYYFEAFKITYVWDFDVDQILSANSLSQKADDIIF